MVEPIFDPKIMPMACGRAMSSAERNEMAITLIIEELCTMDVEIKPLKIDFVTVSVVFRKTRSNAPPVNSLKPFSMKNMPTIKMAMPEAMVLKSLLANKP